MYLLSNRRDFLHVVSVRFQMFILIEYLSIVDEFITIFLWLNKPPRYLMYWSMCRRSDVDACSLKNWSYRNNCVLCAFCMLYRSVLVFHWLSNKSSIFVKCFFSLILMSINCFSRRVFSAVVAYVKVFVFV